MSFIKYFYAQTALKRNMPFNYKQRKQQGVASQRRFRQVKSEEKDQCKDKPFKGITDHMEDLKEPLELNHLELNFETDSGEILQCKPEIDIESGEGKERHYLQFNVNFLWSGITIEKRESYKEEKPIAHQKQEDRAEIGYKERQNGLSFEHVEVVSSSTYNFTFTLYYLDNNSTKRMRNETTVQNFFSLKSIKLPEVSSSHPILTLEIDQALEFLPFKYDVLHKIYPFGQQFCVWLEEGKFSRKVLMPVVDGTNTGSKRAVLGSEYSASASRHENFSKKEEPPKCDAVKNKNAQRTDTCTVFAVNGNTDDSSTPCPKEIPGWNIPNDDIVKQEDPPDPPDNSESKDWIGYFWYFVTALHACIFGENWNFLLVIYLKISAVCASQHTMEFSPVSHYVMLNPCDMCPQVPKLNCAQKEKEVCILNYDRKNLVLACVSNLLLYEACPYFTNSTKNGINYTAAVFQDVNSRCTNCSSYELWDVHNKIQCQKLDYSDAAKNCSKDINTRSDGTPDIGMIFVVCAVVLVVIVLLVGTVLCIRNTRRGQQYINFLPSFLRPRQNDQPNDVTYRSVPMEGRK